MRRSRKRTVDGQPLCHFAVYEGNPAETVFELLAHCGFIVTQIVAQKVAEKQFVGTSRGKRNVVTGSVRVEIVDRDAALACAPMIVLRFDFQKTKSGIDIRTDAQLLAVEDAVMVRQKHIARVCIKIHRIVCSRSSPVDFLHTIVRLCHFQQLLKSPSVGHKFRICTVHQFDTALF